MEENRLNNNIPEQTEDEGVDIDWMELIKKLWMKRKLLIKAGVISAVVGVILALGMSHTYTVTVTLSPEMGSDTKATSGLASLASSFLGGSMSATTDALNATLSSDIVASTPFLLDLSQAQVQTADGEIDTTFCAYLETPKGNVIGMVLHAPGMLMRSLKMLLKSKPDYGGGDGSGRGPIYLSDEQDMMIRDLKEKIVADVDKKTAITTISVTLGDPKVTAIIADSAVNMLQKYIINYRIAKAQEDCNYLEKLYYERQAEYYEAQSKYAQYIDANRNLALQSVRMEQERLQNDMSLAFQIYSQVAQQLQMARAKIQEAKPVFAVLEPAVVPLQPGESRKMVVILIIFLGVAGTAAWILWGQQYLDLIKQKIKEVQEEEKASKEVESA